MLGHLEGAEEVELAGLHVGGLVGEGEAFAGVHHERMVRAAAAGRACPWRSRRRGRRG